MLGDALRFVDPDDAAKGFYFDGRIKENFKLQTGTWVSVGLLRARFIDHFGPIVRDVVFAGPDREYIAALVFPDLAACHAMAPGLAEDRDVLAMPQVRARFAAALRDFATSSTGASTRVQAILLMADPPSLDHGETTDKGSLNQRRILGNREDLVQKLYAKRDVDVIEI